MQPHPSHSSAHASPSGGSLKRPYAQQASTLSRPSSSSMSQHAAGGLSSSPSDRPTKAPKVDNMQTHHYSSAAPAFAHSSLRGGRTPARPAARKQKQAPPAGKKPVIQGPLYDEQHIKATYMTKSVKSEWESNPKSPVANWYSANKGGTPKYDAAQVFGPRGMMWRCVEIVVLCEPI